MSTREEIARIYGAQRLLDELHPFIAETVSELKAGSRPPICVPHSFDADGPHEFDAFSEHAEASGLSVLVDQLTDAIALGKMGEIKAHALLWPRLALATRASEQYRCHGTRMPLDQSDARMRYDESGRFSLAKRLEVLVHPRWEPLKARGNDALAAADYDTAVLWYRRAAALTDSDDWLEVFFMVLRDAAPRSATARRIADLEGDLRPIIRGFLPDCPTTVHWRRRRARKSGGAASRRRGGGSRAEPMGSSAEPNRPRAICNANAAAALLRAGRPAEALEVAREAVAADAEYLKGHHRLMSACRASGRADEADAIERSLQLHEWMSGKMGCAAVSLLAIGWIAPADYAHLYAPAYFENEVRSIAELEPARMGLITVLASIVPILGGQWLTIGAQYRSLRGGLVIDGTLEHKHDNLVLVELDAEHGDIAELPPHGRASARSAAKFSGVILDTLRKLHALGVAPAHLCLGQGLTTFEARVKRELMEAGYGEMTTNAADRTHASKVASMGVEAALGIRKNEAGEVVGMHGS